jgi:predicted transglutaminase-like cysteine proteinase
MPWTCAVRLRLRHVALLLAFFACLCAAAPAGLGFTTKVTPGLVGAYARQFGAAARERIAAWVDFARAEKDAPRVARLLGGVGPEMNALQTVNSFFNRIPFLSDIAHWGAEDYWATPAELSASNGGDCEDYSLAKYFLLRELGVPVERLRITYVKAVKINQAHMVLAYYATPGAEPLILDNLDNEVQLASRRPDLVPVYSFNDEDVVLVSDSRRASSLQIRAWRDLLQKLEAETRL